jgi:hypothetical protein
MVRHLVVSDQGFEGVRLASDGRINDHDPHADLLLAYSPIFVTFPDAGDDPTPPFDKGSRDYHPRPVSLFLGPAIRPVFAAPTGIWAAALLVVTTFLMAVVPIELLLAATGVEASGTYPVVAGFAVALIVLLALSRLRTPPDLTQLKEDLAKGRKTKHLAITATIRPRTSIRQAAWDDYRHAITDHPADYPRTVYARSVEHGDDLFLQYWQFYPFNDWYNWHEADWEVVMVRLTHGAGGTWCTAGVVYSSHLGGLWRAWQDVEIVDEPDARPAEGCLKPPGHPVVYVARGSHAQYFSAIPEGYPASVTQALGFGRFSLTTDWVDVVASRISDEAALAYRLQAFPSGDTMPTSDQAGWDRWWWLRFDGYWGLHEGIAGPAKQSPKWDDPDTWVSLSCVGDPGSWRHLAGGER